jgi:hypothetical protein
VTAAAGSSLSPSSPPGHAVDHSGEAKEKEPSKDVREPREAKVR